MDARGSDSLTRLRPTSSAPAEALSLPGRRVATTARRPWAVLADAGSGRFTHRGVTPLTPIMGRTTDPGENRDPGSEQHSRSLTQQPRLENSLQEFRTSG